MYDVEAVFCWGRRGRSKAPLSAQLTWNLISNGKHVLNYFSPAEEQGGSVARRSLAADPVRVRGLWLGHLPDHPVHPGCLRDVFAVCI